MSDVRGVAQAKPTDWLGGCPLIQTIARWSHWPLMWLTRDRFLIRKVEGEEAFEIKGPHSDWIRL